MLPYNVLQLKNRDGSTIGVRHSVAVFRTVLDYSLLSLSIISAALESLIIPLLSDHTELGRLCSNVSVIHLSPS